tara:strand:+ start:483 stop:758 length:276 start_codon:yes stop_codon:yes gene_type:complete
MGKVKDVQVGSKTIRQLEVKLFVTSMLLQELLDETQGETRFKHKLKFHINGLQRELDKVLSVNMQDDSLNIFINDAVAALEQSIESQLHED